jgi:hypothetical protein
MPIIYLIIDEIYLKRFHQGETKKNDEKERFCVDE